MPLIVYALRFSVDWAWRRKWWFFSSPLKHIGPRDVTVRCSARPGAVRDAVPDGTCREGFDGWRPTTSGRCGPSRPTARWHHNPVVTYTDVSHKNVPSNLRPYLYLSHCYIAWHGTDYKITSVKLSHCHTVCLSVNTPTAAILIRFWWNFAQWFGARKVRSSLFGIKIW